MAVGTGAAQFSQFSPSLATGLLTSSKGIDIFRMILPSCLEKIK
jgi:hypothetical protein